VNRLVRMALIVGVLLGRTVGAGTPTVSWILLQPPAPGASDEPADMGRRAFQNACAICHSADPSAPGTSSLQFKYQGAKPAPLEQRTDLTPALIEYFIRNGVAMMPRFRKTELSDAEASAIAAYLSRPRA
jgi:mono/diheme cytochrome c family protein